MTVRDPWASMITTLGALPQREPGRPTRLNPRPPGVIRPGSATEAVLRFLQEHPGRLFRHQQIVQNCGRSKVAVDWGLAYLRKQGLVDAIPDPLRNARYMRYRAKAAVISGVTPGQEEDAHE